MDKRKEETLREMILENSFEVFDLGHGYIGQVLRHGSLLHLCGYVYVPESSVFYDIDYDSAYELETEDLKIEVHGGLTYAGEGSKINIEKASCLGFDCAHSGDLSPYQLFRDEPLFNIGPTDTYRNFAYVKREIKSLFKCLKAIDDLNGGSK